MTSFIALYQRRGNALLFCVGIFLIVVLSLLASSKVFVPPTLSTSTLDPLSMSLVSPLAQFVALICWVTLSMLIGLFFTRTFFGGTTFAEIYIVGALLGSAALPILYVIASVLLQVLTVAEILPRVILGNELQVYALTSIFFLLLVGIIFLIGLEVINAARKPTI